MESTEELAARIVRVMEPEIRAWIARWMRGDSDRDDVFQASSVRICRASPTADELFRGESAELESRRRAWIFTIVRNEAHRALRKDLTRRFREVALSTAAGEQIPIAGPGMSTNLRARDLQKQIRERLERVLGELSDEDAALILLRIRDDLSFAEISEHLSASGEQIAEATLRQRFKRVMKRLKEKAEAEGLAQLL